MPVGGLCAGGDDKTIGDAFAGQQSLAASGGNPDADHLARCQAWIMISADDDLLKAAAAEGLPIDNPNQHS